MKWGERNGISWLISWETAGRLLWLLARLLEMLLYLGWAIYLAAQLGRFVAPACLAVGQGNPGPNMMSHASSGLPGEHRVWLPVVYRGAIPTPPSDLRDQYEPDDVVPRPISPGETQIHNFYPEGDTDNLYFTVAGGQWYQVSTSHLAPGVDTVITVRVNGLYYRSDNLAPGSLQSRVLFLAPSDGLATVKVTNLGSFGPEKTYRITLVGTGAASTPTPTPTAEPYPWIPTPTPAATPTATPSPTPTRERASEWRWSEVELPEGAGFWLFFARNDTAFVTVERGGEETTYRSDDRGQHWEGLTGTAVEVGARHFWFSPSFEEDGTIFGGRKSVVRSTDGGLTWARRDAGFSVSYVGDVAFSPGYHHPVGVVYMITTYVDGHRHLYRSTNGGDWWRLRMDDTSPSHKTIFSGITAVSDDELLMERSGELWRSEDGGQSWQEVPGFPGGGAIVADGTGRLWLGSQGGVYISADGGQTWGLFSPQPPGADAAVYAGDSLVLCRVVKHQSASLYELTDGGWRLLRSGLDRYNSYAVVASRDLIYLVQPERVERGERFWW